MAEDEETFEDESDENDDEDEVDEEDDNNQLTRFKNNIEEVCAIRLFTLTRVF